MSIQTFEAVCEELAGLKGKARAERLKEAVQDPTVREFFRLAVDPAEQFYSVFPDTEDASSLSLGLSDFRRLSERLSLVDDSGLFGKWARRIINKKLNLGIGIKTLNEAWPGLILDFPVMDPEDFTLGPGETWEQLIHHLEDYRTWYVQGDPFGVRCVIKVMPDGRCFPKTPSGMPLCSLQAIEEALAGAIRQEVTLDGRLVVPGVTKQQDIYEAVQKGGTGLGEGVEFHIQDVVDAEMQFAGQESNDRLTILLGIMSQTARPIVVLPAVRADFTAAAQPNMLRSSGFKACLLRYGPAKYEFGKVRTTLSMKL